MAMHEKDAATAEYVYSSTRFFTAASVALAFNAVADLASNIISGGAAVQFAFLGLILAFFIFANIASIKGFGATSKACRLSEERCYFLGRNLTRFAVVCFAVTIIGEALIIASYAILSHYASMSQALTRAEIAAAGNIRVLTSLVLIAMQIFSIATVYIRYLYRLSRLASKKSKAGTFALFVCVFMSVQLALGVAARVYSMLGTSSPFLIRFNGIMLVVKYILLLVFFLTMRKGIAAAFTGEGAESPVTEEAD